MKIYRKRYIPNEIVDISGDELIYRDEEKLITRWNPIKPKDKIAKGESCVYFSKGWKISKFYRKDGSFKYWYCDIISYEYNEKDDEYLIVDLLLDVIVHIDGSYEILDEDELQDAYEKKIISKEIYDDAKEKLAKLVEVIKAGRFDELKF